MYLSPRMNLAFIIVDDSELDCFIARKIIKQKDESIKVNAYLDATVALSQIKEGAIPDQDEFIVILLDLQLPVMNGFEFMEEFQKLPQSTQEKYVVYVLSSTVNQSDISRVCSFRNVIKILSKPLTKVSFGSLISEMQSRKSSL